MLYLFFKKVEKRPYPEITSLLAAGSEKDPDDESLLEYSDCHFFEKMFRVQ
jgi:hypothetical protein